MKITAQHRSEINAALRRLCGRSPLGEIGTRRADSGDYSANALNWLSEDDARFDGDVRFVPLATLVDVDDHAALPDCATLDVYVTSGHGSRRQLECNVYVTIKAGAIVDVHRDDLSTDARCRALLGVPFSPLE